MKRFVPDYYDAFLCKAGDCRHTCCAGWEIDIDSAALDRYLKIPGEAGERIRNNIVIRDGAAQFRQTGSGRCSFLRDDGLCELIRTMGEDSLCDICSEHPRFTNFLPGREETGLGLCCEAAAELILGRKERTALIEREDDGRNEKTPRRTRRMLAERDALTALVQNRELGMSVREILIERACGLDFSGYSFREWTVFMLTLEQLDGRWSALLKKALGSGSPPRDPFRPCAVPETSKEQLLVYLLFRHYTEEGPAFTAVSNRFVTDLAECLNAAGEEIPFAELCRMWSAEIEYSDVNPELISKRAEKYYR